MTATATEKTVLILGAASAIAEAVARLFAAEHARIVLVGRQRDRLDAIAAHLTLLGATSVDVETLDLESEPDPGAALARMAQRLGDRVDYTLLAYGYLGDQNKATQESREAGRIVAINFDSAMHWMLAARTQLLRQGRGSLVVFGSVAGDRGRRANYVYGAAKAGVAALAEGMAHEFADTGPQVVIVKIGPTDTPMTAAFEKKGLLWAQPGSVAAIIRRAADGRRPVVYAPHFWRWIMLIIRFIPATIFNRMSI
jgi:decaprenylphospho-beta-D-erythro-pentofuranosid-2-ulose 2-reductase